MFKKWKWNKRDKTDLSSKSLGINIIGLFNFYSKCKFGTFVDKVVRDKDVQKQKLEEEEAQYMERRKERARKIMQIEKEELSRRETEVSKIQTELDKIKRKNEEVEDELQSRVKALQMELEDMKLENRSKEGVLSRDIDTRMATIQDLRLVRSGQISNKV